MISGTPTRPSRDDHVAQPKHSPGAVLVPKYTLPELDYDYGALEPHISGKIMELHHGKHHAGYVKNANLTITLLEEARAAESFTHLAELERALAERFAAATRGGTLMAGGDDR
jgi:hypothetical protein